MLERILNTDIEADGDGYTDAIGLALQDRLLSGLSTVRVRYEVGEVAEEEVEAKLGPDGAELAPGFVRQSRPDEEVEILYVHWKDQLWSPARYWEEVRWWAFDNEMSREDLQRFGPEMAATIPLNARKREEGEPEQPWDRARVWEIWDRKRRKVFWFCEGCPTILGEEDDPLGLEGFFPFPRPMVANCTTKKFLPRPDFVLVESLYDEVDLLSTRITLLEQAVRVAGVYDRASGEVSRLLGDAGQGNVLVPVDTWAAFAERGGLRGVIDWLPLDQIVAAISTLSERRRELMDGIYQLTGMSDIMRGQASAAGASATEQAIKARFASVRMQAMQGEFSRFCADVLKLKAEIVRRHFAPENIVEQSNVMATPDAQLAQQAVELLKSGEGAAYRIEVKPESIAMQDFAALKSERLEVLGGLGSFFQAAAPIVAQMPGSMPFFLQILQWSLAGIRGASEIEGVMDHAIAQAKAQPPQQQQAPDQRLMAVQMKGQLDAQREQQKLQNDLVRINAEVQADAQRERTQATENTREAMQKALISRATKTQGEGLP
jgi:hypothetical protein